MHSMATTVDQYLASLPADRRESIARVLAVVRRNLPGGYEEVMNWGMVCWQIPLTRYPKTYNGYPLMLAALASQKNHSAIYLTAVYGDPALSAWFHNEFRRSGKRLDAGKSCVRFRTADDLPLELIGRTIKRVSVAGYLAMYERARTATGKDRGASARVTRPVTEKGARPAAAVAATPAATSRMKHVVRRASAAPAKRLASAVAQVKTASPARATPRKPANAPSRSPAKPRNTAARKRAAARRKSAR